ncbi:hypothetical protein V8G54_017284 [Vigna mungo]|uniref:Uncharacterized protein n=1 Tax=Vigna mungo TaxID=3915 RepID=A0AAQ3S220_VIGMU
MSNSTPMEKDLTMTVQRSSYMPGCMMSPSCLPIHNEFQYSRIHYCSSPRKRVRRWKNILRKFMRESKTLCRSKPISFQYDPVSYSQNFDEGCHLDEPRPGLQDLLVNEVEYVLSTKKPPWYFSLGEKRRCSAIEFFSLDYEDRRMQILGCAI